MADGARLDRLELNRAGVEALLKSPEVQRDLERRGRAMAVKAGAGVEAESAYIGRARARVTVITRTAEARRNEATGRTLTRAIDAGR